MSNQYGEFRRRPRIFVTGEGLSKLESMLNGENQSSDRSLVYSTRSINVSNNQETSRQAQSQVGAKAKKNNAHAGFQESVSDNQIASMFAKLSGGGRLRAMW